MQSPPPVSVIIPNYNHAGFLEERIRTVLDQTYANFEIIILDDNSADGSKEIINKFSKHPRVKTIIGNPENSGSVFKQWVKGISLARGKYLWIAESDDYADELFLQETVKLAEEYEKAGLVFTDSYNIDRNGNVTGKVSERHDLLSMIKEDFNQFKENTKAPAYFIDNMLILNASAVLFNLQRFKETVDLLELENYKNTGDQFSYLSIFLKHEIIYLNKPLNYRRIHGSNTTAFNFLNGVIYKERIKIINFFFSQICYFPSSKDSFNNYLQQNFLKVADFRMHKEMSDLLEKFYSNKYFSFQKYFFLKMYLLVSEIFPKRPPFKFRREIKKVLRYQ